MEQDNNSTKKKTRLGLFFRTLLITLVIFIGVFGICLAGLSYFGQKKDEGAIGDSGDASRSAKKSGGFSFFSSKEEKIYALVLGVDDDKTHTDTMIIACFDPETEEIALLSLPRDSKVTIPEDRINELKEMGSPVPSSGVCKLTEVHHYAYLGDKKQAVQYLEKQLTDMLGVEFDFYVKVDLAAFNYLVEQIGGVEFDVPVKMYYNDPLQNLLIDLQPGIQLLNGKNAEGLVRFRSYPGGDDFMRMKVQQEFIKAFIKQALAKENIVKNIPAFASAAIKYVDTDFDMTSLPGYLKYLNSFSSDNIQAYTLPVARTETIGGKDYVILDDSACKSLVNDIFFGKTKVEVKSSEDLRIQVLNGGGVTGLAKSGKELLETNGFSVLSIGDYSGVKSEKNRIFVSTRGMGEDIKKILKNSDIVYDPSLDANYDIIIVIGKLGLD